jgi:hypothetical protein
MRLRLCALWCGSEQVLKAIEIQKWYLQPGDIADINEIRYTSLPRHKPPNPTALGAKNPLIIRYAAADSREHQR